MSAFDCTRHFQLQLDVTHGAAGLLSKPRRRSPSINCQFHPNRLALATFTSSTELPATLWSSLRAFKSPRRLATQLAGATQSSTLSESASNVVLDLDSHMFLTMASRSTKCEGGGWFCARGLLAKAEWRVLLRSNAPSEFDSFLSIGPTHAEPAATAISSIGIPFGAWDLTNALHVIDGSVRVAASR